MSDAPYVCTPTSFTLNQPVADLALPARTALSRWAREHDLALTNLAVGRPIERDEEQRSLRWREVDGAAVVVHVRFPPYRPGDAPWPKPFPETLLRDASTG